MKNFKKIFAIILMACMMLTLNACGSGSTEGTGSENNNPGSENESTVDTGKESESTSEDDGKIVYTVKVVDEEGKAIVGTYVQVCHDGGCSAPVLTDANGVAAFPLEEGTYRAALCVKMPEGYVDCLGEYVNFEGDATEVTITLKKAA